MTFRKLENPDYCPGVYDLALYCDHENDEHGLDEFPHEIVEFQTRREAYSHARKAGWKLHKDNTATCPKCVKRIKKGPRHD